MRECKSVTLSDERALRKAQAPQSAADQMLRNKVGQTYFERGQTVRAAKSPREGTSQL